MQIDSESNVWLGDDCQRDTAKRDRYHGSVAALPRTHHGIEIAEKVKGLRRDNR